MKRRTTAYTALGLSAALGLGACSSGGNNPELKSAVQAVCAEATSQAQILSEPQANGYMNAVGTCILSLEGIAPAGDRQQGVDTVTTNSTTKAGLVTFTLTDRQSGTSSVGWSIAENLISNASPTSGEQVATEPYDITAEFAPATKSAKAEWLAELQTNNLRDGNEIYGAILDNDSRLTPQQIIDASSDWDNLQKTTNTLLGLAEAAILQDAS